jgi:hypothetical protein
VTGVDILSLFDVLNCAATAIDETGSGRLSLAEDARREAVAAASLACAPDHPLRAPLDVILCEVDMDAVVPVRGRADLWHALTKAGLAVLIAGNGDLEGAAIPLLDANGHAQRTQVATAFRVVLDAIADIASSGAVTA